jgi:hypothetical protein
MSRFDVLGGQLAEATERPVEPSARDGFLEETLVGTCSLVQVDPTGGSSNVNRVFAWDGNSTVNLASQGHCAGVFIGIRVPSVPC